MPSLSGKKAPLFLILALAACGDPELGTSLNSAGPPELVEIHVTRDNGALVGPAGIVGGPSPAAIFCTNDADLKVSDSFCADRTATLATGVSAVAPRFRIIFDELLDPAIETLEDPGTGDPNEATLRDTQPVTVTCGGTAVTYDGFYDPSGNALTGPPGPALVINVADILGTDTECTIELNDGAIKDKDGNAVPAAQNGPYTFTTSALRAVATQPDLYDPELGPVEFDPTAEGAALLVGFNAPVDQASLTDQITLTDDAGNPVAVTLTANGTTVQVTPDAPLVPGVVYTMTVVAAGSTIADTISGNTLALDEDLVSKFALPAPPPMDGGMTDAGMTDGGMTDGGMTDAGTDGGMTDAGSDGGN